MSSASSQEESELKVVQIVGGSSIAYKFNAPQGICYDRIHKELWVADTGNGELVCFDDRGFPVARFKHFVTDPETGERKVGQPIGVAVDSRGRLYVTDLLSHTVDVMDYRGRLLDSIDPTKAAGLASAANPTQIAIDSKDNVYVVDGKSSELMIFDSDLRFVRRFNLEPSKSELGCSVAGLCVDRAGRIYVTNKLDEPCVGVFSPEGKLILSFGEIERRRAGFAIPGGVAVTDNGDIWVADSQIHVVKRFDSQGNYIDFIGGLGREIGAMRGPIAIATDGVRRIYVLERRGGRFQAFELPAKGAANG